MKKLVIGALLSAAFLGAAFAQDGRLSATIDLHLSIMKYESKEYSDRNIRPSYATSNYDYSVFNLGPTDKEFFEDANISVSYEEEKFGGKISVDKNGLGGFRAWVKFIPQIKLSAGTDLDGSYADDLDADPGLRIYVGNSKDKWQDTKDPDNISSDEGLMLEGFLGPVTLAAVATYNDIISQVFKPKPNTNNLEGEVLYERNWQYGGRLGSGLGKWGKVNASYIVQYKSKANSSSYNPNGEFVVIAADAEVYNHSVGLFASLTPLDDTGITFGWITDITKYLDSFTPQGSITPVDTLWPTVFKNGLNLNIRYKGIPNITLRTDHNFSFWTDKNYTIMGIPNLSDVGLSSNMAARNYADVEHWLLWNGLGAFYALNNQITVGLYARNLRRSDTAEDYQIVIDEIVLEPKVSWKLNNNIEFFAALNYAITIETMSKELTRQKGDVFVSGAQPVATRDITQVFKIPLGFIMKL
jgi:hypothetical protein